jgi:hypothetical protein
MELQVKVFWRDRNDYEWQVRDSANTTIAKGPRRQHRQGPSGEQEEGEAPREGALRPSRLGRLFH